MGYLLGVILSLTIQGLKKLAFWNQYYTYTFLLILSVAAGFIYQYATVQSWWPIALQVLTTAATVHNLILRNLQDNTTINT